MSFIPFHCCGNNNTYDQANMLLQQHCWILVNLSATRNYLLIRKIWLTLSTRKSLSLKKKRIHMEHLRKENMTKAEKQILSIKEIRNSQALNQIWNAPFMGGIRGTNVSIIHRAKTTSPVQPTAIALILEDVGKDAVNLILLAMVMVAMTMAMVAVQASLPFKTKLCPSWLERQPLLSNTTLTILAKILSGGGMKQMLKTQVNKTKQGTSCSDTRKVFLVVN
jgi:hypothetical protein